MYPPPYRPPPATTYRASDDPNGELELSLAERAPGPGARTHDGFFFRFGLGFGAGGSRYRETLDSDRQRIETVGVATLIDVAIGGSLTENLIAHGSFVFANVDATRREADGKKKRSADIVTSTSLFGAGLTYYFMPINLYVSGAFGLTKLGETRGRSTAVDSRAGYGATLSVGKEWWLGATGEWGLGLALRGTYASARAEVVGSLERMYVADVGLLMSLTLN